MIMHAVVEAANCVDDLEAAAGVPPEAEA